MAETPETVRQVIRSWIATEVLAPQITREGWSGLATEKGGRQRNKATANPDGAAYWESPLDDDPAPWPLLPEHPDTPDEAPTAETPDRPRRWFHVVLGAIPARAAFHALDAAFSDDADDDETGRPIRGDIIAASAVLNEWGVLVPDTLAIASFAWGAGHILNGGDVAELARWAEQEQDLKARLGSALAPAGHDGRFRSLTWRDLRDVSAELAEQFSLPPELWHITPCAIEFEDQNPPPAEILSSFHLPDLMRLLRDADHLPHAAAAYLGLQPPETPWDPLADRQQLSSLLHPSLFPLGRWPGPGLHPLNLLQQAAVNAIVRDLTHSGLAAVNGPPGTGKTTLLRDLVANILVSRAELLAEIDRPWDSLNGLNLMDFAIVVASANNAAVENVSLELPLRSKALDQSVWLNEGLDYFGDTASAVLGLADSPEDERAWGLMAARLGNTGNRRDFFERFWWDHDWGLKAWLHRAGHPNAARNEHEPPGLLVQLDPPPRWPQATATWQTARDNFRHALKRSQRLREELEAISTSHARLRETETQLPNAERQLWIAKADLASAATAVEQTQQNHQAHLRQENIEKTKLDALSSLAPSRLTKLFRTLAWRTHESEIRRQIAKLEDAQDVTRAAAQLLSATQAEQERLATACRAAQDTHDQLADTVADLQRTLRLETVAMGVDVPGPGFWTQPDDDLQRQSPWNKGLFRIARDDLFIAAVRLHKAFIVAAARKIKPSLDLIARSGSPGSQRPSAEDWGLFFLTVPVVSTTFASIGRMFQGFAAAEIGWLLIDEAGQAAPQAAAGAIWRARRAVVIGDPLQIEPVVTSPTRTTRLIFESNGMDAARWAAPRQSAQTLADRASAIQGRFETETKPRVTGIPLLVHRRCDRPMFDIANRIAYDRRMVFAVRPGPSPIRDLLGDSAWIDIDAPTEDKWVEAEGRLIVRAIARLGDSLGNPPDLYVICPFKLPAQHLRTTLRHEQPGALRRLSADDRRKWINRRVGTVHKFQGKEAEAVILMLGAGRGARHGSRLWAGRTPNLLNVAATRAKRALYIVGNRAEWKTAGYFADPAANLPVVSEREWLADALAVNDATIP